MNIILNLQFKNRQNHLTIEEILEKAKSGKLTFDGIEVYQSSLQKDILEFDEVNKIIKVEELSCFSKKLSKES